MMRLHPEAIRSVIIDSVVPPSVASLGWTWTSVDEGFNNLFSACAAQPDCAAKYPDLANTFTSLVQQLDANPLTVSVVPPQGGSPVDVLLDGGWLFTWLVGAGPPFARVPKEIEALAHGDPTQIATERAGITNPDGFGKFGYGLTYGVFCSEWVPFEP